MPGIMRAPVLLLLLAGTALGGDAPSATAASAAPRQSKRPATSEDHILLQTQAKVKGKVTSTQGFEDYGSSTFSAMCADGAEPESATVDPEVLRPPAEKSGCEEESSKTGGNRWLTLLMEFFIGAIVASCLKGYFTRVEDQWSSLSKSADKAASRYSPCASTRTGDDPATETVDSYRSPEASPKLCLALAAQRNDAADANSLLEAGAPVNAADDWGCTALHVAASCGAVAVARVLLARGADAAVQDSWDESALHFAARSGSTDVCEVLLEKGASVNAANADGVTPLVAAARAGHAEACRLLLARGGCVGETSLDDLPMLLVAMMASDCIAPETED